MSKVEIKNNVFWVGVVDWNIRNFHGYTYSTKRGTTYNAYLIIDEKITLIDTVMAPFAGDLIKNISEIIDPSKIDYIVANHVESDHSGALPEVLKYAKNAQIICTQKCKEGLFRHYYGDWNFKIVKTGDSISLGKKTLKFIEAPMIHWPDSMFTYLPEEKLLMPNDAFGQHIATSKRFDDEIDQCALMEEAAKYYANILIPLSPLISKKIADVVKSGMEIDMIAPSHGIIWRKDPMKIVNAYAEWSKGLPLANNVLIVYETMWKSTEKIAKTMLDAIAGEGITVKMYDINTSDRTEIITDLLDTKCLLIGSSTHDNNMLPGIAGFLDLIKGLKLKGRTGAAFGSYGWSGEAVNNIQKILEESGIGVIQPPLSVKYVPSESDIKTCFDYGKKIAGTLK